MTRGFCSQRVDQEAYQISPPQDDLHWGAPHDSVKVQAAARIDMAHHQSRGPDNIDVYGYLSRFACLASISHTKRVKSKHCECECDNSLLLLLYIVLPHFPTVGNFRDNVRLFCVLGLLPPHPTSETRTGPCTSPAKRKQIALNKWLFLFVLGRMAWYGRAWPPSIFPLVKSLPSTWMAS